MFESPPQPAFTTSSVGETLSPDRQAAAEVWGSVSLRFLRYRIGHVREGQASHQTTNADPDQ